MTAQRMFTSESKRLKLSYPDDKGKKKFFQFENGVLRIGEEHFAAMDGIIARLKASGNFGMFREVSRQIGENIVKAHRENAGTQALKGGMHSLGMSANQAALAKRDAEIAAAGGLNVSSHELNNEIMLTEQSVLKQIAESVETQTPLATEEVPSKPASPLFFGKK